MEWLTGLLIYLLSSMGLTVLIVWPEHGPSAWLRERVARPIMPSRAVEVLDCYICMSFWAALALSPVFWWVYRAYWCWMGCLMTPALFWVVLRNPIDPNASQPATAGEPSIEEDDAAVEP